jgi:hypothetical protein
MSGLSPHALQSESERSGGDRGARCQGVVSETVLPYLKTRARRGDAAKAREDLGIIVR